MFFFLSVAEIYLNISIGSDILPSPSSPHAKSPESGPIKLKLLFFKNFIFSCVIGFFHISTFIDGTKKIGLFAANNTVVAKSFAMPAAA